MDNNQNDMPEYVKNLPQEVQDFVYEGVWEERVTEIAKKYSLGPGQTDVLINNTLFVLIGLDTPDTFTNLMTSELGISKLLAGQIVEELETRIFEYALNQIQTKPVSKGVFDTKTSNYIKPTNIKSDVITMSKAPFDIEKLSNVPNIPKIRPETVPMIEKNEPVRVNIPKKESAPTLTQTSTGASRITYTPRPYIPPLAPKPKLEPIKSPVPASLPNETSTLKTQPIPPNPPEKKYTLDPYREPIE